MTKQIREAAETDLPALVALYNQLGGQGQAITLQRADALFSRLREYPDYRVYVAEEDGQIVGTFLLLVYDALGYRARPVGLVEDVVVDQLSRGRGIGRDMMNFAMERCREAGCYKLVLSSNLNREDAHRFYESLGFKKHGFSFEVELGENL
jgi:GNAT superfamily N-acetyltransferase